MLSETEGFPPADQCSAPPSAKKTAGQIELETLKKRITNIEQGIMNVEVRYSARRELLCRTVDLY